MNGATIAVLALLAAALVLAIRAMVKKKGGCSCGGDCSRCCGCSSENEKSE